MAHVKAIKGAIGRARFRTGRLPGGLDQLSYVIFEGAKDAASQQRVFRGCAYNVTAVVAARLERYIGNPGKPTSPSLLQQHNECSNRIVVGYRRGWIEELDHNIGSLSQKRLQA